MTKEQSEAIEYFMDKIKDAIPRYTEMLIDGKIIKEEVYQIKIRFDQEDAEKMKTVLNMLKEKDAEIEKKDKMIDLLVNKLNQNCKVFENSEIKEIVEIYEKIKSTSNLRGIEVRKECIKQYFERKVEDECKR